TFPRGCISYALISANTISCCSPGFTTCWRRCSQVVVLYGKFNPSLIAMIQLKPGIPPASLKGPSEPAASRRNKADKKKKSGLRFEHVFSDGAVAPFDQVEWERRVAEITDDSGKVIFKQEDIEVPKSWSALATKIAVSKYFYGDIANGTDPYKGGR